MPGGRRSMSIRLTALPTSCTISPTYGLNTCKTARSPITQEAIEALTNRVKDAPFTIMQMSSSTLVLVVTAIQAVAFLLKDVETSGAADAIMEQVMHSLITKLADANIASTMSKRITEDITAKLVDHVIAAISPQVALVYDASQSLTSTLEEMSALHTSIGRERTEKEDNVKTVADHIEDAADALHDSVETYQKALQILTPSLDATQEKIDQLPTQILKTPAPSQGTVHPSYSSVVTTHLPPQVDKAIGCAALQAHQILLDPLPGGVLFSLNTSKCDMATKIKTALEAARNNSTPEGTICSITALHNGANQVGLHWRLTWTFLYCSANANTL
ncbi:uncharacterized protein BJ212DRAFT_1302590 [Suillus subaureus]|uniref:Uncharacterized protein n=1 Tax=Suillus subaureus TaxID=48587 RepID=A0A9P7J8V1_9AGAM|nr:uncharacterized protein BJ212DRAFT_1302590 [Suillus subaureus]KAG1809363.1 hypothetical protein BJ212DRAFT_1302590 [Suillus subaureus]